MQEICVNFTSFEAIFVLGAQALILCVLYTQSVKYDSKILLLLAILFSGVFVGMRFNFGLDTQMYTDWIVLFGEKKSLPEAFLWSDHEKSFIIISYFLYKLTGTYRSVFLFYSIVTAFFFLDGLWYFRKKINIMPGLLYYITFIQWNNMCNIMRQIIAVAIVFWGIRFIYERKNFKFLIVIIMAFMFHSSALAAIPIMIYGDKDFIGRKYLKLGNILLATLLLFAPKLMVEIMAQISDRYAYTIHYKFGFGFIVNLVILYILYKYGVRDELEERFVYMIYSLTVLATILLISDYTIGEAARFREYYNSIYLLTLGAMASDNAIVTTLKNKFITYFDLITYGYPALYFMLFLFNFLNGREISFSLSFMN